jgi:hypothetical protein
MSCECKRCTPDGIREKFELDGILYHMAIHQASLGGQPAHRFTVLSVDGTPWNSMNVGGCFFNYKQDYNSCDSGLCFCTGVEPHVEAEEGDGYCCCTPYGNRRGNHDHVVEYVYDERPGPSPA